MSAFEQGLRVLQIAAAQGNTPSQAVLDELTFRQTRIDALHELNSELNSKLREARQQLARCPEGWNALFDRTPGDNDADPMEHLTHVND